MKVLENCQPREVFKYFEEICNIPHGSGNTKAISDYLVAFARSHNLKYRQDEANNVIIWKAESVSASKAPVIIQGHMDMVAVKTDDCNKDMETEGLDLEIIYDEQANSYVSAKNTSLGGDDGIAVAYALALLASEDIPHPPLEVIITVDEEVGMLGADALDVSDIKGRMLMNIDSEDEGIFTVSCAGGETDICHIPVTYEEDEGMTVEIALLGLKGGHSGVEIGLGRLNGIIAMGRILKTVNQYIKLVEISGGEKDNAIARFASCKVLVKPDNVNKLIDTINLVVDELKNEYKTVEPELTCTINELDKASTRTMNRESTGRVINTLVAIPNGVIRMNPDIESMVQTSLNLGVVSTTENEVIFTTLLRSSSGSEKEYLSTKVNTIVSLSGGYIEKSGVYPGWNYSKVSQLRDVMIEAYEEQYGCKPVVEGIHAGLECGLFADKIEGLDCISFGPRIDDIHTTSEKLSISSVERTWNLIINVLGKLA